MEVEYFPVLLKQIIVDSVPDFDLYLKQKDRFVLYRKANIRFSRENLVNLIGNKIESIYVSKEDSKLYERYNIRMRREQGKEAPGEGYEGKFADPGEVDQYHDILDSFLSIEITIFQPGMVLDFPIYFHNENKVDLFPEFSAKPDGPWEITREFSLNGGGELMVRNEDVPKYRAFVKGLVDAQQRSYARDSAGVKRQAVALREMSKIVVKDVLDDPRSGKKIKELDDSVKGLVGFILDNDTSFYSLMRLSTYDFYTYVHSLNVCTLCVGLGSTIGLPKKPDLELLGLGAMLHDIGKSQIDSRLINKPGKLNEEEFKKIKGHVRLGSNLLKEHHNLPQAALEVVEQHHEKLTGTGYPSGLKGYEVTLFGRISVIVDIYDALTTERSYKKALTPFQALSFLSKTQQDYDKDILRQFVMTLGRQIQEESKQG